MWFGDLVTMRWWDDLWLNESFAEWASHHALVEATKYDEAWTGFTNARKNWAYRQDQLPSTHPIAADNHDLEAVEVNFDGITYAKGASALKQLVAWVGEERVPRRAARPTSRSTRSATASSPTCCGALEETSGRDLRRLGRGVAADLGVNTLTADFEVDDDGRFTSFAVRQTAAPRLPDAAPAPHRRRPLRPRRGRPAGPPYVGRDRRRRRAHRGRRAGRASSSRTWCCSTTAT